MWERIGASSGIVIGAFVLFALFALALFIMEREKTAKRRGGKGLCAVPKPQGIQYARAFPTRLTRRPAAGRVYNDMKMRKIS